MLLGQHCTGQNPMHYCPRSSRQHYIRKNSVQCCLNTLETTMHRSKPYAMFCLRSSRQHCIRKNSVQCCLNTLGSTLHSLKPYAMLSERLQAALHMKKFCSMLILLGQHCTDQNPLQYCLRGSRQHCTEKVLCNILLILLG